MHQAVSAVSTSYWADMAGTLRIIEDKIPIDIKEYNMATILIIDDEPAILDNMRQLLMLEGHTVLTSLDGQNAIKTATEQPVHLILCDMLMQSTSGFQILQAILNKPATAHIPFIFVTAVKWEPDMETGASDYLFKPYTNDELLSVVHKHLPG
jgi:CheY-like chemotaxis protein